MSRRFACWLCGVVVLSALLGATVRAQPPAEAAESPRPEIGDEPKTIDPATLVPAELAAAATHDFADSSLREVVEWLQQEQGLVVLLDRTALSEVGVSPAEPISERLDNTPLYLLLNRLRSIDLAWYYEDEILHITSSDVAEERLSTVPYNVGDLIDGGYGLDKLEEVIRETVAPESWDDVGGPGALDSLGDVLFVRQTDALQREVQGLLAALRSHARQTFVNDPPQHLALREKMDDAVSVDFLDTPLETAIGQLAELAQIDIRLDVPALREARVREREPVTLKLQDRKLETVLQAIVLDLDLTWVLRDGVLWITTTGEAENFHKIAVYDVRDLCRDESESEALIEAVRSQAKPSSWDDVGGPGAIEFAKAGTVVITHQERIHAEVLYLLESYRTALRTSKRRPRQEEDPNEVITVYYRTHAQVAEDLYALLPKLVRPESWRSDAHREGPGEVFLASSAPERHGAASETEESAVLVMARAVLIIRQTRATHDEIEEVIRRVESGDARMGESGGLGGGLGGGGFGGGFLSDRQDNLSQQPK